MIDILPAYIDVALTSKPVFQSFWTSAVYTLKL